MSGTEGDSRVGTVFGRYRLRRLLGKGGMGEVYEAEDTEKDRIVALKLLPEAVSHDPVFRKRLQREAHSAGRLLEPHVVPIHDYGEIDGIMFVDMRMIDGTDLRKILKNYGPMTPARAVAIVKQIASALDAAHEAGIMHRDVKPENVLITRDDFAYLVDFGIANAATDEKLTELGTAVGTYAYMAPERFTNDEVTYRADIYALACVLHECLTGSQPFPADSVSVVITSHLMQPIPRPSVMRPGIPVTFDHVIARGMAKKAGDRFASAGDFAAAANDALTQRDQDQAADILHRSQEATMPGYPGAIGAALPFPPGSVTPSPYPTPPPTPPAFPASSPAGLQGQWNAPPPAGPKQNSATWIPLAAAAAVFVVALGAFGVWWIVKKDDSSNRSVAASTSTTRETTTRSRPPRTTATPPPDSESFDAKLFAVLPASYDDGACTAAHPPATGALATVDCTQANVPTGPMVARYSLFADQPTLDAHFKEAIGQNSELVRCPGSELDSPTAWFYNANPDDLAGQVACGVYDGNQDVTWTKDADLMLADAQSANLEDLHKWWNDFG
jgi:serine/threonine kinase PknH